MTTTQSQRPGEAAQQYALLVSEGTAIVCVVIGAIFGYLSWLGIASMLDEQTFHIQHALQLLISLTIAAVCLSMIFPARIARAAMFSATLLLNGMVVFVGLWKFGGYWRWLGVLVAAAMPVLIVIAIRKKTIRDAGISSVSDHTDAISCDAGSGGDCGGGD